MAEGDVLIRRTAVEVVELLRKGEVTPLELIDASLARIRAVDPAVNALPTICVEHARDHARRMGGSKVERGAPGWLGGLPIAIKDLMNVTGVRSTSGSPIFADFVPETSDVQVETLEKRGGIVVARSNTSEFGAGANTFNPVFGKTRNPWNTALTCGGSSGGSAVALATGMVWLANGSDLGGSLRIPASFCSVVGMRPSPGWVAQGPAHSAWDTLGVSGPMARNVADIGLMLDAMAGFDPRDPLSRPPPRRSFLERVRRPGKPKKVGYSPDLGFLPVDPEVQGIAEAAARKWSELGATVEAAAPDFSGAREVFRVLRAARYVTNLSPLYAEHRAKLKPDIVANIEAGLNLTADQIGRANREREALYQRVVDYFASYDLLLTPTVIVPPFDVDQRYVESVGDHRFEAYWDWLGLTYAVTLTGCPALSLPCGFTASGLPVGLQMVGRPYGDGELLGFAGMLEQALGLAGKTPIDPQPPAR
ncbi:MAG TPA: amidase family protein [Stellaceae bacterium]|nr:amidase family protein [Stellaceae bacterium]